MGNLFIGTYNRSIDSKGRLQLPPDLACEEGETLYVMRGLDGCISVFPESAFLALVGRLSDLDFLNAAARAYIREAMATSRKLKVDPHGRINLKVEALKKYSIESSVLILGVMDHFEIWNAQTYAAYQAGQPLSFEALAEEVCKK